MMEAVHAGNDVAAKIQSLRLLLAANLLHPRKGGIGARFEIGKAIVRFAHIARRGARWRRGLWLGYRCRRDGGCGRRRRHVRRARVGGKPRPRGGGGGPGGGGTGGPPERGGGGRGWTRVLRGG